MLQSSQIRKLAKPYSDTHICHTNIWDWRLTNNDLPRPCHYIPRPVEVNLEMASQPALM